MRVDIVRPFYREEPINPMIFPDVLDVIGFTNVFVGSISESIGKTNLSKLILHRFSRGSH